MIKLKYAELPPEISIFPLNGVVVFPRSKLPLNIFEPRYLAMVEDALKTSTRLIGMIQTRKTPDGNDKLHHIGCAGRIVSFDETDDGRYMVTLEGISRYRFVEEKESFAPYRIAQVNWESFKNDIGRSEIDEEFDRPSFLNVLFDYFKALDASSNWENLKDIEEEHLVNSLSMACPFNTEEKQALLEAPSLQTRRETLMALMNFALIGRGGANGGVQ